MSIRNRLTLWFAAILFLSLAVMAFVFHYELAEDRLRLITGQPLDSSWEETGEFLLFYGLPAAALLLVGGSWLLRRSLRPISRLTVAAENMQLHRLHNRLPPVGTGDELDRLTGVFNAMTARLENSFAHVREFTLHASHELKTPLTVMQGELEAALSDETLSSSHRELISGHLDEVQRLARIVDSLALLAKADAGMVAMKMEPVNLSELVRDSFEDAQVLARARNIRVVLGKCDEISVKGDRHRLRQLLLNLMDNAVKHNRDGGIIEMQCMHNGDWAELRISNSGPGLSAEQLSHVFERFFRGDPARGSSKEGCGLGLAISKWIVEAHGGSISLKSTPPGPTAVEVRLPQAPHAAIAPDGSTQG